MLSKFFDRYKNEFKDALKDLSSTKTFYKQIPNILTFMRLTLAIPAGILYYFNPVLSMVSIGLLWFTDAIDGKIARKFDLQSRLGADMDAVADKMMFLASALPLLSTVPFLCLNFLLEGVISLVNVYGRFKGVETKTVLSGKVKTVSMALTLIYGYLHQLFGLPKLILTSLIGITSVMQTISINDYISVLDKMKHETKNDLVNDEINLDKDLDKAMSTKKNSELSQMEQLLELRKFVLDSQLPNKKYSGKKRTRIMVQEKKNS